MVSLGRNVHGAMQFSMSCSYPKIWSKYNSTNRLRIKGFWVRMTLCQTKIIQMRYQTRSGKIGSSIYSFAWGMISWFRIFVIVFIDWVILEIVVSKITAYYVLNIIENFPGVIIKKIRYIRERRKVTFTCLSGCMKSFRLTDSRFVHTLALLQMNMQKLKACFQQHMSSSKCDFVRHI